MPELILRWPDGREAAVFAAREETILAAAEGGGQALPFGCRRGACTTCTAELLDGVIDYTRPPAGLKSSHREDRYVLTCIAQARTDSRLRVDVQDELTTNPWGPAAAAGREE